VRKFIAFAVCCSLAVTPALAQAPSATANRSAYNIALMCNAVAAYFRDDAAFQRTADAVQKMGRVLAYDGSRTAKDMVVMGNVLGDQIRKNPSSIDADRARCRRIGFAF
jgi:hypothetical protein